MPAKRKYTDQVTLALEEAEIVSDSAAIKAQNFSKWPQTVDGWVRKLGAMGFGLDEVAMLEAFIQSGMALEALAEYEKKKDNIPFETAWELYGYSMGSKQRAEKAWRRLSVKTQEKVLKAIVRYNRYCQVTGVFKMHFSTYLNGRSYLMELPTPEKWTKWREVLKTYAEKIDIKSRNPQYLSSDDSIDAALEALMYRHTEVRITQVMGVLRWMRYDWDNKYKHLINIVRACDPAKFPERLIAAQKHINIVEKAMQTKSDQLFAYDPENVEQRVYQRLAAEAKAQDTEED
jgi:hypothetical protein